MMKTIARYLPFTALALSLSLAACGGGDDDDKATKDQAVTELCACAVDPQEGETQADCEATVTPLWASASQACFDCVVAAADKCGDMEACFEKCPSIDNDE